MTARQQESPLACLFQVCFKCLQVFLPPNSPNMALLNYNLLKSSTFYTPNVHAFLKVSRLNSRLP